MLKNKKTKIICILLLAMILPLVFPVASTEAASDANKLRTQALINSLKNCYDEEHMSRTLEAGLGANSQYEGIESIFFNNSMNEQYLITTKEMVYDNKKLECRSAMESLAGAAPNKDDWNATRTYLEKLGYYTAGRAYYSGNQVQILCMSVDYDANGSKYNAGDICWEKKGSNGGYLTPPGEGSNAVQTSNTTNNSLFNYMHFSSENVSTEGGRSNRLMILLELLAADPTNGTIVTSCGKVSVIDAWQAIGQDVSNFDDGKLIKQYQCPDLSDVTVSVTGKAFSKTLTFNNPDAYFAAWVVGDAKNSVENGSVYNYAYQKMRGQFDADTTGELHEFSVQEVYDLYIHYLKEIFDKDAANLTTCSENRPTTPYDPTSNTGRIYTAKGWCDVVYNPENGAARKVTVPVNPHRDQYNKYHYYFINKEVEFGGMIEEFYTFISNIEGSGQISDLQPLGFSEDGDIEDPMPDPISGSGYLDEGERDPCYESANQTGWLLCPLIRGAGKAMENLYGSIIKDYLNIDAVLLRTPSSGNSKDAGSGTYQAWSIFVGFGNTIMIAFLIVIIFSQLTGVGIDNYGIKKALPKIIIAAVLINASFILCQIIADLSNIIGNALENMLTSIGDNLKPLSTLAQSPYGSGEGFKHILNLTLIAGGVSLATGAYSSFMSGGPAGLILPIAIGFLIALAAILFFFTLLGIRKAAIVMLVAVSPLAFACYMLPNLKKQVFDRWFGLMKTMVLAYPICGLVIGGSNLTSAILMTSGLEGNFLFYFINMLLMVVPFFFVPSLLKKSMGALGNITQKASNMVRGRAQKGGERLKKWNQERPANKQRRLNYDEQRRRRNADRVRQKYAGRDLSKLNARQKAELAAANEETAKFAEMDATRSSHAKDSWLKSASNKARSGVEKEAMQTSNFADQRYYEGSLERAKLDTRKDLMDTRHFASKKFAEGQQFLNDTEVFNQYQRATRYAASNGEARRALLNKLDVKRDEDRRDDGLYATKESYESAIQMNIDNETKKRIDIFNAALSNGNLKVDTGAVDGSGNPIMATVNQNTVGTVTTDSSGKLHYDPSSLAGAHQQALQNLVNATTDSERATAEAQVSVFQSALMRTEEGRQQLIASYEAASGVGYEIDVMTGERKVVNVDGGAIVTDARDDRVRMAASKFMEEYSEKLKGVDRSSQAFMLDLSDSKRGIAGIQANLDPTAGGNYFGRGIDKLTVDNIGRCDKQYLANLVKEMRRIDKKAVAGGGLSVLTDAERKQLAAFAKLRADYNNVENTGQNDKVRKAIGGTFTYA